MPGILDNTTLDIVANGPLDSNGQSSGHRFHVQTSVTVTGIKWYATDADAAHKPVELRIRNETDNTTVMVDNVIATPGSTGWKIEPIDSVTLVVGKVYSLAWGAQSSYRPLDLNAAIVAPPWPYVLEAVESGYNSFGNTPNIEWAHITAVDLVTEGVGPQPPDDPPATEPDPGTLDPGGSLAYWLHQATTNPDSLPKLNKAILDTMLPLVEATNDLLHDAVNGLVPIRTFLSTHMGAGGAVVGQTIFGYLDSLTATSDAVLAQVEALLGAQSQGTGSGGRPIADTVGVLDPGYTLTDTLTGQGSAAWSEPADRYVFTVTAMGASRKWESVGGINMFGYRGSASPLEVDLVGRYIPLVGEKHLIYEPGFRFPGVLINVEPDIEWTLEAYTYVPPAP